MSQGYFCGLRDRESLPFLQVMKNRPSIGANPLGRELEAVKIPDWESRILVCAGSATADRRKGRFSLSLPFPSFLPSFHFKKVDIKKKISKVMKKNFYSHQF